MDTSWETALFVVSVMMSMGLLFLLKRLGGERLQEVRTSWVARLIAIGVIALVIWLTLSRAE
jgi:fumarate reductase subunit D